MTAKPKPTPWPRPPHPQPQGGYLSWWSLPAWLAPYAVLIAALDHSAWMPLT